MLRDICLRVIENCQKFKYNIGIKNVQEPPLFKIKLLILCYVHDLQKMLSQYYCISEKPNYYSFIFTLIWKEDRFDYFSIDSIGFNLTQFVWSLLPNMTFIITQRRRWEHNVSKLTSPFGSKWNQFSSLCYFFIWLLSCCGIFSSSASFICCALSLIW